MGVHTMRLRSWRPIRGLLHVCTTCAADSKVRNPSVIVITRPSYRSSGIYNALLPGSGDRWEYLIVCFELDRMSVMAHGGVDRAATMVIIGPDP